MNTPLVLQIRLATVLARPVQRRRVARLRTVACCARLCRAAGGELEQFNSLLDTFQCRPPSRYLGCTQRIASAVNDRIGIEPN